MWSGALRKLKVIEQQQMERERLVNNVNEAVASAGSSLVHTSRGVELIMFKSREIEKFNKILADAPDDATGVDTVCGSGLLEYKPESGIAYMKGDDEVWKPDEYGEIGWESKEIECPDFYPEYELSHLQSVVDLYERNQLLQAGLNQAIELLVTALQEPGQITDEEIAELRGIEKRITRM